MKRGYTIVEVLVTLSIVLILAVSVSVYVGNTQNKTSANSTEDFKSTDIGVSLPEPTNYYVDEANVLTQEQKLALVTKLNAISEQKKIQIGVLIATTTKPLSIEQYSIRLAEKWKVGYKGQSNGAIIIIAVNDRTVRIETGHGLTGTITDSEAKRIIDNNMVPLLKSGEWYKSVDVAVDQLNSLAQ